MEPSEKEFKAELSSKEREEEEVFLSISKGKDKYELLESKEV